MGNMFAPPTTSKHAQTYTHVETAISLKRQVSKQRKESYVLGKAVVTSKSLRTFSITILYHNELVRI